MRSLFFKIFLWFWLADVLVVGAFILSTMWTGPSAEHQRRGFPHVMDDLATFYGQQAVKAYEEGGKLAAGGYIEELEATSGLEGFLFSGNKEELLGQMLPGDVQDRLEQWPERWQEPPDEREMFRRPPLPPPVIVSSIEGKDGRSYLFAMKIPPGPMHDLMIRPTSIIVRVITVIAVVGLVCYGLALYLTRPLRKLQFAARRLATGDFSFRIGRTLGNRHDEIGDLGRDFDFMVEQIDSLVSGQKRLLRDISHEIRSPLTRLNVALELARQRTGEQAGDSLNRIELEVGRINDLVGQLLTLARLENKSDGHEKVEINLCDLLQEIAEDAGFEAKGSNKDVRILNCENCRVIGSPELLRSAIENVARNAVRYTAEKTEVELSLREVVEQGSKWAELNVRDHGPGVPAEDLAKIFEPFYRVTDSRDRKTGGIGLGLTISERAVKFHGGLIEAMNEHQGGLKVRILLPMI
jgi:two-component system sensor histidine kinase CpxA